MHVPNEVIKLLDGQSPFVLKWILNLHLPYVLSKLLDFAPAECKQSRNAGMTRCAVKSFLVSSSEMCSSDHEKTLGLDGRIKLQIENYSVHV